MWGRGCPRLELELWRGQTGEAEAKAEMRPHRQAQAETTVRERVLLISPLPVSSQRLSLAKHDRKPADEEPGKRSFLRVAAGLELSRIGWAGISAGAY